MDPDEDKPVELIEGGLTVPKEMPVPVPPLGETRGSSVEYIVFAGVGTGGACKPSRHHIPEGSTVI